MNGLANAGPFASERFCPFVFGRSRVTSRGAMIDERGAGSAGGYPDPRERAPRRWRWGLASSLVPALLLAWAGSAAAAKVKGRVSGWQRLVNPVWEEARAPSRHGYSFREPVPTVGARFRRLFPFIPKELCIAALAATPQKPDKPILIRVGGGRTTPVTIVVPPGTTLQFQNTDPFKHRLYGVGISTFPPADTIRGASREWSVPGPGTFEIRDQRAPSLRMWVVGEPKVAAIAYPSMKGDFLLTVPEPGDYTVQVFFSGKKIGRPRDVTIKKRDVDLKRPIELTHKKSHAASHAAGKK